MNCPNCGHTETTVKDSRPRVDQGNVRWRRRRCLKCDYRWSTVETAAIHLRQLNAMRAAIGQMQSRLQVMAAIIDAVPTNLLGGDDDV